MLKIYSSLYLAKRGLPSFVWLSINTHCNTAVADKSIIDKYKPEKVIPIRPETKVTTNGLVCKPAK